MIIRNAKIIFALIIGLFLIAFVSACHLDIKNPKITPEPLSCTDNFLVCTDVYHDGIIDYAKVICTTDNHTAFDFMNYVSTVGHQTHRYCTGYFPSSFLFFASDGIQIDCQIDVTNYYTNGYSPKNDSTIVSTTFNCPSECGNGELESGEECDDNNIVSGDGCSASCENEYCGDNTCNNGEICSSCEIDCGICPSSCGNNITEIGEECDLGILLNGVECWVGYGDSCEYCTSECKLDTLFGPYCGDEEKQVCEECDDGNKIDGDGCSANCKNETLCGDGFCNGDETCSTCEVDCGVCPSNCGNSITESDEQCDNGTALNGNVCNPLYNEDCTYCTDSCLIETLIGSYCGDGVKDVGYETCDNGTLNGDGCSPEYGESCSYCSSSCEVKTEYGPYCGDGNIDSLNGEECDDGNNNDGDGCSFDCKKESKSSKKKYYSTVEYEDCIPFWECSQWGECDNGVKYRECNDLNSCSIQYNEPYETIGCEIVEKSLVEKEISVITYLWILLALLGLILIILLVFAGR